MHCSGLHCSGCGVGAGVPPIAFVAAFGVAWVAEHLVIVAATSAVCGALAVAAVVALMRWQDRRQAAFAAQASIWTAREIRTGRSDLPAGNPVSGLTDSVRPAIGPAAVHLHFHGLGDDERAEVIRRAIGG